MKKVFLVTVVVFLFLFSVCYAEMGTPNITAGDLSGIYLFRTDGYEVESGLEDKDLKLSGADGEEETVRSGQITMISGDESFKNAVSLDCYDAHARIVFDVSGIQKAGEATYLLKAESEHYQAEYEFQAVFMNQADVEVHVDFDTLVIPVSDEPVAMHTLFDLPIRISPEMPVSWRLGGGKWLERAGNADEAELLLKNIDFESYDTLDDTYLQIRKTGQYEMELCVYAGVNRAGFFIPLILEGVDASVPAGYELRK